MCKWNRCDACVGGLTNTSLYVNVGQVQRFPEFNWASQMGGLRISQIISNIEQY